MIPTDRNHAPMMPLTAKRKSVVLGFSMPGHAWHAVAGAGSSSKHYRKPAKKRHRAGRNARPLRARPRTQRFICLTLKNGSSTARVPASVGRGGDLANRMRGWSVRRNPLRPMRHPPTGRLLPRHPQPWLRPKDAPPNLAKPRWHHNAMRPANMKMRARDHSFPNGGLRVNQKSSS